METKKLQFTKLQSEIFNFLSKNVGKEINQNLLAKELKCSPTAVAKSLKYLEKENLVLVKRNKIMNLNLIELNRENQNAVNLKRVENLKSIYESRIIEELEEKFPGGTIILFGSYSKGEDNFKSDIDLAIIGKKEKTIDLSNYEKYFNKEIILNFYASFKEIDTELKNNLCNGTVLSGGINL